VGPWRGHGGEEEEEEEGGEGRRGEALGEEGEGGDRERGGSAEEGRGRVGCCCLPAPSPLLPLVGPGRALGAAGADPRHPTSASAAAAAAPLPLLASPSEPHPPSVPPRSSARGRGRHREGRRACALSACAPCPRAQPWGHRCSRRGRQAHLGVPGYPGGGFPLCGLHAGAPSGGLWEPRDAPALKPPASRSRFWALPVIPTGVPRLSRTPSWRMRGRRTPPGPAPWGLTGTPRARRERERANAQVSCGTLLESQQPGAAARAPSERGTPSRGAATRRPGRRMRGRGGRRRRKAEGRAVLGKRLGGSRGSSPQGFQEDPCWAAHAPAVEQLWGALARLDYPE